MSRLANIFIEINVFGIFSFLVGIFFLLFGLYVHLKNDNKTLRPILLCMFVSFSIWCMGHGFLMMSKTKTLLYSFHALSSFGFSTIFSIIIHFFVYIINDKPSLRYKVFVVLNYLGSLFVLWSIFFGDNIPKDYIKTEFGWSDVPNDASWSFWVYSFLVIYWVVAGLLLATKYKISAKKSKDINKRKQANVIFTTGLITITLTILFNHILPLAKINFPAIGSSLVGIWLFGLGYSVVKYKFLVPTLEYAGKEVFTIGGEINIITDLDFNITEVNNAFVKNIGYSKEEAASLNFYDLIFVDGRKNQNSQLKLDTALNDSEMQITTKQKHILFVNFKISALYYNESQTGYVIVLADITELKNKNTELELKVAERTKLLAEARDEAERRLKITQVYTRKSIVDVIQQGEDPTLFVPSNVNLSILFADIRDFTFLSEKLSPSQTVALLNTYFENMNECVLSNNGEIDKLMGDCIMALFRNSEDSISCAIQMRKKLELLNASLADTPNINNGIGINYGEVTMGNIGSDTKMDWTVIGDIVNSASRLESLTKIYGLPIIVSEELLRQLSEPHNFRFIDIVQVKGKEKPIKIFEVFDHEKEGFKKYKLQTMPYLKKAFDYYKTGDFEKSTSLYKKLIDASPKHPHIPNICADPVLHFFYSRSIDLLKKQEQKLLKDWNGVYECAVK